MVLKISIESVVVGASDTCYDLKVGGNFIERFDRKRDAVAARQSYQRILERHVTPAAAITVITEEA